VFIAATERVNSCQNVPKAPQVRPGTLDLVDCVR
jgi:hypothetical protein